MRATLEASTRGLEPRFVVTSLENRPKPLCERAYCARAHAENLIKMHESQPSSDRTSYQSPNANPFRLILHTAA